MRSARLAIVPDRHRAIVTAPKNIGMAIVIEVADAVTWDVLGTVLGLATRRAPPIQIEIIPLWFCQWMSSCPLPSKSPVPAYASSRCCRYPQIETAPLSFCHRMSS